MSYSQGSTFSQESEAPASNGAVFPPPPSVPDSQAGRDFSSKRTSQSSDQVDPGLPTSTMDAPGYCLNHEHSVSPRDASVPRPVPIPQCSATGSYVNPNISVWPGPSDSRRPKRAQSEDPHFASRSPRMMRSMSPAAGRGKSSGRSHMGNSGSPQHTLPSSSPTSFTNILTETPTELAWSPSAIPAHLLHSPPSKPPTIPLPDIPSRPARKQPNEDPRLGKVERTANEASSSSSSSSEQRWFLVELVQGENDEPVYLDHAKTSRVSSFPVFLSTEVIHLKPAVELQAMISYHLLDAATQNVAPAISRKVEVLRVDVVWENSALSPTIWTVGTHTGIRELMQNRNIDGLRVKVDTSAGPQDKQSSGDEGLLSALPQVETASSNGHTSGEAEAGKSGMFGIRKGFGRLMTGKGDDSSDSIKDGKTGPSKRFSDGTDRITRGVFTDMKANML